MNERIRELATQAGYLDFDYAIIAHKFADLLIRECISVIEDTNDRHRKDYFAEKIKQHFGIQE
jgi:hypothetical protein